MADKLSEVICKEQKIIWKGKILKELDTLYHNLKIMRCGRIGVVLFIDDVQRSMTLTSDIYAECLAIPALLECGTQGKRADILVVGCPEGIVHKAFLRSEINFKMVHLYPDEECVQFCSDFLPYGYEPDIMKKPPKHLVFKFRKIIKQIKSSPS